MQFRDLRKQYSVLKQDIDAAMMEVAAASAFIMGRPVKELEAGLAEYVGVKHCISCGNGTDALTLALKVWNIGAGDAVFVPDFTFFSSAEVISLEGATPVFVDVDGDTFNMDASDLERKIARTIEEGRLTPKVIITVDLFGLPANYPAIRKIADAHRLFILEDGAQGFGGMIGNKRACSFGDISTTSFFPRQAFGLLRRRRSGVYRQRRMGRTGRFLPGARQGHVQVRQCAHRHELASGHFASRHSENKVQGFPRVRVARYQQGCRSLHQVAGGQGKDSCHARRLLFELGAVHHLPQ